MAVALLASLSLAGCAARPVIELPGETDFAVTGKMAVIAASGNLSARFRWLQTDGRYDVELWGPFGQGRRRMTGNDQTLTLLNGKGDLLVRGPVREVMRAQLGFELPLTSLAFWIQGQPDPSARVANLQRNGEGQVADFDQLDWQINYPAYTEVAPDRRLPKRIEASNAQYRVKLAISRWDV